MWCGTGNNLASDPTLPLGIKLLEFDIPADCSVLRNLGAASNSGNAGGYDTTSDSAGPQTRSQRVELPVAAGQEDAGRPLVFVIFFGDVNQ